MSKAEIEKMLKVRLIFVVWLVCWSAVLAWTHYRQTMSTHRMLVAVEQNIDSALWIVRFTKVREEAENFRIRQRIQRRLWSEPVQEVRQELVSQ